MTSIVAEVESPFTVAHGADVELQAVIEDDETTTTVNIDGSESVTVEIPDAPEAVAVEIYVAGPQGPASAGGVIPPHIQSAPAATWTINHNLNTRPEAVVFVDGMGRVYTDLDYPDENTVSIELPSPLAGRVYLKK